MNIDDFSVLVPQTYGEAVKEWGDLVVNCEPHEWDNRTTEENALWLLARLHSLQRGNIERKLRATWTLDKDPWYPDADEEQRRISERLEKYGLLP